MTTAQRTFWPYAIALFLGCFLVAMVTLVVVVSQRPDDLVAPDYYAQEVRYQEQIERLARTAALAEPLRIVQQRAGQPVVIAVPAALRQGLRGQVRLFRPADARQDRQLALQPNAEGLQQLEFPAGAPGRWQVQIRWEHNGQQYYTEQQVEI
jgi:hypothetical protein